MTIHEVFPYLRVRGAAQAIEFYKKVFGAEEEFRLTEPCGRIGHAQVRIGPAVVMLADEFPELGIRGPQTFGGTTVSIHLHVDKVDRIVDRAVACGATILRPPADQFYGERTAAIRDPFGHEWLLGHHIEEVEPEEMQDRYSVIS